MYERAVSIALFDAELAERFEIGLAFDVAVVPPISVMTISAPDFFATRRI